ncbi:MAG: hypothetical protein JO247_13390 [Chloroflexi bacterium]|nr:hypothetical protein [Chloroflexota bacterium]
MTISKQATTAAISKKAFMPGEYHAFAVSRMGLLPMVLLVGLSACGTPNPVEIANAYGAMGRADDEIALFGDDATYVAVNGATFHGKEQIAARLTDNMVRFRLGEIIESPHADGDDITWTQVIYPKLAEQPAGPNPFTVKQSIWVTNGRIDRAVVTLLN